MELYGGDASHIDLADEAQVAALKAASADLGLRIHSIHAPWGESADLAALDESERQAAISIHLVTIHAAAELGAQLIVLHPGPDLAEGGDLAAHLAASRRSLLELIEAAVGTDPQLVGYCLDTGHAFMSGLDCAQMARSFGQRLISIHLHDNHGDGDYHLLPGLGDIPWPPFFEALAEIGYTDPITIEARPPENMQLTEALAHVQRLLASVTASASGDIPSRPDQALASPSQ